MIGCDAMLSGDKASFAIEYELNENFGGRWLFGKLAYWIGGERIGDYDAGTTLADVLGFVTSTVKYAGRRPAPGLCRLSANAAFEIIDRAVFGRGDEAFDTCVFDDLLVAVPGTLLLLPGVDTFDNCRAYTFECLSQEKIIYKKELDGDATALEANKGTVLSAARPFYDWLNDLYEHHVVLPRSGD